MRKGLFYFVLLLLLSFKTLAINLSNTEKIDGIVELPIKKISAVESKGQIYFISDNGRFVLSGQLYDLWYKKTLDTLPQMEDVATRLHFKLMNLDIDTLNTVSMGEGTSEVVIFVDPLCPTCHEIINEAKKLTNEYVFKLVVIPALGEESNKLARTIFCAKDKTLVLDALINQKIDKLDIVSPCNTKQYDQTLLIAHLLSIQGVPFIVAPDGRISQGKSSSLSDWLEIKQ